MAAKALGAVKNADARCRATRWQMLGCGGERSEKPDNEERKKQDKSNKDAKEKKVKKSKKKVLTSSASASSKSGPEKGKAAATQKAALEDWQRSEELFQAEWKEFARAAAKKRVTEADCKASREDPGHHRAAAEVVARGNLILRGGRWGSALQGSGSLPHCAVRPQRVGRGVRLIHL